MDDDCFAELLRTPLLDPGHEAYDGDHNEGAIMRADGNDASAGDSSTVPRGIDLARRHLIGMPPLTIDPPSRRLRHEDGREIMIEPRMMQVLVALAEANGSILSRDDLIACCWNGRIVGDEAISSVIYRLRKTLKGLAGESILIETVSKVGFRLLGTEHRKPQVQGSAPRRWVLGAGVAASAALLVIASTKVWFLPEPGGPGAHSMQVRLALFSQLSHDLPATMANALNDETIAAFADDGWVNISTGAARTSGAAPAYALGGSIRRDGDKIKVITRLANERTGATLWSNSISYDAKQISRVPRLAGINTSIIVRCGLFAASTHPNPLPDPTLTSYFGFCANYMMTGEMTKALDFARKAVRVSPDFSAGWSAVEVAAGWASWTKPHGPGRAALRSEGIDAADRALRLDPANSEAYAFKNHLLDPKELVDREALLKKALDARPLACGCEHHYYGDFLTEVGRSNDAIEEYRRAVDVLPVYLGSQMRLARALIGVGREAEAKIPFEAAMDLTDEVQPLSERVTLMNAPFTRQFGPALKIAEASRVEMPAELHSAIVLALQALQSGDKAAKAQAIKKLAALPSQFSDVSVRYLGALGANQEALHKVEEADKLGQSYAVRAWLFYSSMAGARADPAFSGVAERLGLMQYWRTTKKRPDFCFAKDAPPVCRVI